MEFYLFVPFCKMKNGQFGYRKDTENFFEKKKDKENQIAKILKKKG